MIKEMGRNWFKYLWIGAVLLFGSVPPGVADVVEFTDKDEWVATANDFVTIGFTGFNDNTFITDQFAELGLLFSDGDDNIAGPSAIFPSDSWGLDGNEAIHLEFLCPQFWIAADFPGALRVELFSEGQLAYTSGNFSVGGVGNFAGLVSTEPFDAAVISDWVDDQVNIDDLHFGAPKVRPPDVNGDGVVDVLDLIAVVLAWGSNDVSADINLMEMASSRWMIFLKSSRTGPNGRSRETPGDWVALISGAKRSDHPPLFCTALVPHC